MSIDSSVSERMTWQADLASLVDSGISYADADVGGNPAMLGFAYNDEGTAAPAPAAESVKDQLKELLKASGEMLDVHARGCGDIPKQSLEGFKDSPIRRRLRGLSPTSQAGLSF